MANNKKRYLLLFLLLLLPGILAAEDATYMISNSGNWQDVYSTIHYANLNGMGHDFLVSTAHGVVLLNTIHKGSRVKVITSKEEPFVFNYVDMIIGQGVQAAEEVEVDNANLELARELDNINKFIVVGDSYGYNAIAVAPYARLTNSWVFLANRINIYEIDSIITQKNPEKVLIYGFVDREVREVLEKYNPEIIDTGNKFQDNIEIVEKFKAISNARQVVLTNGEFIEREIMNGAEPVLFTGRQNVPDQIRDYLKESDIEVGVLIGNDLVGAATNIRRSAGISVMVKFARGARSQNTGIAAVEGLDLFPLPTPTVDLALTAVKYNRANSQLEITYKSNSNVPIYFKGTITVKSDLEETRRGDMNAIFIAPGDYKTVTYPTELRSTENLNAEIYTLFGETPTALDRILQAAVKIETVEIIDRCKFKREDFKYVRYSKQKRGISIKTKNTIKNDCWVDLELEHMIIGYRTETISTEGSTMILAGKTKKIFIKQDLTTDDLEKNPEVSLIAFSGEREDSLVNVFPKAGEDNKFTLEVERITAMTYAIIVLVIIIILLIIIMFIIKRREREDYY